MTIFLEFFLESLKTQIVVFHRLTNSRRVCSHSLTAAAVAVAAATVPVPVPVAEKLCICT